MLRAGLIAAVVAFAAAGSAAGQGPAAPAAAAITPIPWTFSVAEGQAYSGIAAAFLDLDNVSAGNFTNVFINWGDGTISSGTVQQSGVELHVFFISEPHTFTEEGTFVVGVSFGDSHDGGTVISFANSIATVGDAPLCACLPATVGAPMLFPGVGGNSVSGGAFNARAAFESAIGGANNGGTPSPQPGGFRTINWDGVMLNGTDFGGDTYPISPGETTGIPINRFQERGTLFSRVYAVSQDGFADVNPFLAGAMAPFSTLNDMAPFNTHQVGLSFVRPSLHTTTAAAAGTRGFGTLFINVHNPLETSIEYFDGPVSLGLYRVPPGPSTDPAYTFFGVLFTQPIVTRVQITLGTGALFTFDGTTTTAAQNDDFPLGSNVVALDDLAYAEPQSRAPAPTVTITPTINVPLTGRVGSLTDTDPNGNPADMAVTIDWGDGHTSPGHVAAAGAGQLAVSGSNTYTAGGNFQITFTVQDFGGATVTGSAEAKVPPPIFIPDVVR